VTYGTTTKVKAENFKKFADLIEDQFRHGGSKYALNGFEDREATDVNSIGFWALWSNTSFAFAIFRERKTY
jgi:hypothetical protein